MFNGPFVAPASWPGTFNASLVASINNQARANGAKVPPCALAAIVMRESGGQNILQEGVPPGPGCGVGLTQITYGVDWSNPANPAYVYNGTRYELMDPSSNLYVSAAAFLAPAIGEGVTLQEDNPQYQVLEIAFAIYNAGYAAVNDALEEGRSLDSVTTNDYASGTYSLYEAAISVSGG